jgi:hypothetical protein
VLPHLPCGGGIRTIVRIPTRPPHRPGRARCTHPVPREPEFWHASGASLCCPAWPAEVVDDLGCGQHLRRTRPPAPRPAAFRPLATVGVPLCSAWRVRLLSTTLPFAGLDHAACLLLPSRSVRPWLGVHVAVTADLLARLGSGGTCTSGSHLLGNHNPLHGMSPNSKVSGLPWRDQCRVRRLCGQGGPTRSNMRRPEKPPQ